MIETIDKVFTKTHKISRAKSLVSIKMKKEILEFYKSFGAGYTSKMSKILEYAKGDKELLKKCGISH